MRYELLGHIRVMARLGAHLSAAGGAWRAVEAARSCGCEALQLFLRAPGRWAAAALAEADVVRFREAAVSAGVEGLCFAHAPYLLNLASDDENLRDRSVVVLVEELQRAGRLGLAGVVLHPGSGGEGDRVSAEARCRAAVSEAVERAGDSAAALLPSVSFLIEALSQRHSGQAQRFPLCSTP